MVLSNDAGVTLHAARISAVRVDVCRTQVRFSRRIVVPHGRFVLMDSLVIFRKYKDQVEYYQDAGGHQVLARLGIRTRDEGVILQTNDLQRVVIGLFVPSSDPIGVDRDGVQVRFSRLYVVLGHFNGILCGRGVRDPSRVNVRVIQVLRCANQGVVSEYGVCNGLIFHGNNFFIYSARLAFRCRAKVMDFRRLVVVGRLLCQVSFFMVDRSGRQFRVRARVTILRTSAGFTIVLHLACLFFVVRSGAIRLVSVLVQLFAHVFVL